MDWPAFMFGLFGGLIGGVAVARIGLILHYRNKE